MTTYLGMRTRTVAVIAAAAIGTGAALVAVIPTRCVTVEHGITGPEPEVTVGRTVQECSDGTQRITEWHVGDDGYPVLTSDEYADVLERLEAVRRERGGRWTEGS